MAPDCASGPCYTIGAVCCNAILPANGRCTEFDVVCIRTLDGYGNPNSWGVCGIACEYDSDCEWYQDWLDGLGTGLTVFCDHTDADGYCHAI